MNQQIKHRINSFKYAFEGIVTLFRETPNAKIHLTMAILAIGFGFFLKISLGEWLAIAIVIGLVVATEAVNTAIETLADFVCNKTIHPAIKKVKDLAAAAVLITAIAASIVGIIIFLPKIIDLFS